MGRLPLRNNELLGVVKHDSKVRFYAAWLAEWILDYLSYDPTYDPAEDDEPLRDGLLVVRPDQGIEYCEAMQGNEINAAELSEYLKRHSSTTPIDFYIDFDDRLFVNGFHELPIEEYVPIGWTGVEDNPIEFVPDEVRAMWTSGLER